MEIRRRLSGWIPPLGESSLAAWVASGFLLLGSAWIVLSDRALGALVGDPARLTAFQTYKGWAFVVGATVLLYVFIAVFSARESRGRTRVERRMAALLSRITDAFFVLDPEWRFTYANRKAEELFGISRRDLRGLSLWEVFPEAIGEVADRQYRRALETDRPRVFTARSAVTPGRFLEQHVYPSSHGLAVYARDVTEQRRLERQLQHAQKMEAVGRLAGGYAHDFNNILTAIKGTARLARQELPGGDAVASVREDLEEVERHVDRAAELTRQLLTLGRKREEEPRVLAVDDVVDRAEMLLRRLVDSDAIAVELTLAAADRPIVADPGQLEQILMNLIANARDALPDGGTLRVATAAVDVDADAAQPLARLMEPGRYVRLTVSDTGIGMDDDVLARVFEPFFTTKGEDTGTGLGLSMVYALVRQNRGYIFVESEPGEGTTFQLYFPIADAAAETGESGATDPERLRAG